MRTDIAKAWSEAPLSTQKPPLLLGKTKLTDAFVETHIPPHESVLCILKSNANIVVGVVTDKTVYRIGKTIGVDVVDTCPIDAVTGVRVAKLLGQGVTLSVQRANGPLFFIACDLKHAEVFADTIRSLNDSKLQQAETQSNAVDPMEQIVKLKALLDAKLISAEEFEDKRQKLLDSI
ncbi:MAG: SHOCT domain-containing protein [Actinomycetes bacterium]|jgi:hypothetical protein